MLKELTRFVPLREVLGRKNMFDGRSISYVAIKKSLLFSLIFVTLDFNTNRYGPAFTLQEGKQFTGSLRKFEFNFEDLPKIYFKQIQPLKSFKLLYLLTFRHKVEDERSGLNLLQ